MSRTICCNEYQERFNKVFGEEAKNYELHTVGQLRKYISSLSVEDKLLLLKAQASGYSCEARKTLDGAGYYFQFPMPTAEFYRKEVTYNKYKRVKIIFVAPSYFNTTKYVGEGSFEIG